MHKYLCAILPYRKETWDSQMKRFVLNPVEDEKYGTIYEPYYNNSLPRKMKWHWGHNWDLIAHCPTGSSFICSRCNTYS